MQPCASLSFSLKRDGWNKDREEEKRVVPRSRIALFSSCTLSTRLHIHTPCANTYTHPARIVPYSKSSQGPQPVPSLSLSSSPFFLHLFLPFCTTVRLSAPDTRPTCKSCRDLVYLRDSRFPTGGGVSTVEIGPSIKRTVFLDVSFLSVSLSHSSCLATRLEREIDREIDDHYAFCRCKWIKEGVACVFSVCSLLSSRDLPFCRRCWNSLRHSWRIINKILLFLSFFFLFEILFEGISSNSMCSRRI